MSSTPEAVPTRPRRPRWPIWIRYPLIAAGVYLVACGALGLGLPALLTHWGLPQASELLGREVRAGQIRFNPFKLRLTAEDLTIAGPAAPAPTAGDPAAPMLALSRLVVDLSISSLRHRAPVIEALRLEAPTVRLSRGSDGRFSFADIEERLAAKAAESPAPAEPASAEPARFALNNIELSGGQIHFDDRQLGQVHTIADLALRLPFISNLPDAIEINVEPALAATINGSPLTLTGQTLPFHDSHRTTLDIDLRDLVLEPYLKLSPTRLGFTLPQGRLTTALKLAFIRDAGANRLSIDGQGHLDELAIHAATGGDRLVSVKRLDVTVAGVEPLAGKYPIERLAIDGLDVDLKRNADGSLPLINAFAVASAPTAPPAKPPATATGVAPAPSPPPSAKSAEPVWSIAATSLRNGKFQWTDQSVTPAVRLTQEAVQLDLGLIGNHQAQAAPLNLSLRQPEAGQLDWKGELDLRQARAGGRLEARIASIAPYLPYFADQLGARVATGPIELAAGFEAGWSGAFDLKLADSSAAISALRLELPGDASTGNDKSARDSAVQVERLGVSGLSLDLARSAVTIAQGEVKGAQLRVVRDRDGRINLEKIATPAVADKPAAGGTGAKPVAGSVAGPGTPAGATTGAGDAWSVSLARLVLADNRVLWRDEQTPTPVVVPISGLSGTLEQLGTQLDARSTVDLRATLGRRGQIAAKGGFVVAPLSTDLVLQLTDIPLAPFDPYAAETLTVALREGQASGQGRLRFGQDRLRFAGRLGVQAFKANERGNGAELLRWGDLSLSDLDINLATGGPAGGQHVSVGGITLAEFAARVELSADGRFNLQDIVKASADPAPAAAATAKAGGAGGSGSAEPIRISLGGIQLKDGSSNFTDHFVKPNYSVNLSQLNGSVSAMASDSAEAADVRLDGRIDGDAPIQINGKLNPLGPTLYTDIAAAAKGIDLPTFTPYSGKYAGYAIEKGKLSLDVRYKIENERLEATNRLFLDQLTFGEKVDSPDAVDLPIQFAVGLLKNRRGEIDISLPIGGSLNDPEFSIGGIVWNAIVNLLTRVVTAPFSALASAFGGSDEELSFVEFRPGTAELTEDSLKRIGIIGKALADRPSLKLEIAGRMNPAAEREAFGRQRLDERLQAAQAETRRRGRRAEAGERTGTAIPAEEKPALLVRVAESMNLPLSAPANPPANAANTANAPTNAAAPAAAPTPTPAAAAAAAAAGKADVDSAELERRLIALLAVDAEAQRGLATRRAQVARDHLTGKGGIAGDRIFLLAPRIGASTARKPATGSGSRSAAGEGVETTAGAAAKADDKGNCNASCAEFSLRQ